MPVYKYAGMYVHVSVRVYISWLQFNMWMNSCMMQVWHVAFVLSCECSCNAANEKVELFSGRNILANSGIYMMDFKVVNVAIF